MHLGPLYPCICNARVFHSQKALTIHENVCPKVALRDKLRFAPYPKRLRTVDHSTLSTVLPVPFEGINSQTETVSMGSLVRSLSYLVFSYKFLMTYQTLQVPESTGDLSLPPVASTNTTPGPHNLAVPISQPDTHRVTRSRTRRLRMTYREEHDALPEAPAPLPHNNNQALLDSLPSPHVPRSRVRLIPFETPADSFGRYRIYPSIPHSIPDSNCVPAEFSDHSFSHETTNPLPSNLPLNEAIAPCPNLSTFYFLHWFWNGGNKSIASREELRTNVILNPGFNPRELDGVDLRATDRRSFRLPCAFD